MLSIFIQGLSISLSLIVAIGPQNTFVLRQGIKNQFLFLTCTLAILGDAILVGVGILGFGNILSHSPLLTKLMTYAGILFLFSYGFKAIRSAFLQRKKMDKMNPIPLPNQTAEKIILSSLAFSFLNPHAYLDFIVLLGGISSKYPHLSQKSMFGFGAFIASIIWFYSLGFGAKKLAPIFQKPIAWFVLDLLVGVTMWTLALFFNVSQKLKNKIY